MRVATVFLFLAVLISLQTQALPVVGEQAIFQDDKDSNFYYYHPDRMVLASDSATKHKKYGCFEESKMASATATFAFENSQQLNDALTAIKTSNPNAKFAVLSLRTTQFVDQQVPNINVSCPGSGVSFGSTAVCMLQINGANACNAIKKAASSPSGIHILDFSFTFRGMVQGQFKEVTRVIPVIISGLD